MYVFESEVRTLVGWNLHGGLNKAVIFRFRNATTGSTSVWGTLQPWHSFTSTCTSPPLWSQHLPLHEKPPPTPPPPCSQKCWVLLFAFHVEIRWGCELSPNICSLEWRRRGEGGRGGREEGRVHGVHSTYVLCMFWVNIHTQTHAHTWANNYSNGCFVSCWTLY